MLPAVLLVSCAVLALFFLDRPGFLISSDTLLQAEFVWDALHHGYAWSGFQQSRVPSIFPDLLVFAVVQAVTGSWRIAMALWVFVALGWLMAVASWITARIARCCGATATFAVLLLFSLVLVGASLGFLRYALVMDGSLYVSPYLIILLPNYHSGPFLIGLTAAAVASRAAEPTGTAPNGTSPAGASDPAAVSGLVVLALLAAAMCVSDLLCVTSLLLPLTAALLAGLSVGAVARRTAIRLLVAAWGGGALGWICAQLLSRQSLPFPNRYAIEWAIIRLPTHLAQHPGMLIIWGGLAVLLATDGWRRGMRGWLGSFWSVFAVTSALGSLALTMLLYVDVWSYRYALPFLWWTVILAAAALARICHRRPALLHVPVVAIIAGLAVVWLMQGWHTPRLISWKSSLAECLQNAGMRAGLADYWLARRTGAATDWQLQIDPLAANGSAYYWGNDRFWFTHDIHDDSRRPLYRFIVMDRLPPPQIAAVYGHPDRVMRCEATEVWVYDDPDRLYHDLERASPSLASTFAAAPAE
jgi:hypothetical protein